MTKAYPKQKTSQDQVSVNIEKLEVMLSNDYNGIVSDLKTEKLKYPILLALLTTLVRKSTDLAIVMSQSDIATAAGISTGSVKKYLEYLKHKGIVFVQHRYRVDPKTGQGRRVTSKMVINIATPEEEVAEDYAEKIAEVRKEEHSVAWTQIYKALVKDFENRVALDDMTIYNGRRIARSAASISTEQFFRKFMVTDGSGVNHMTVKISSLIFNFDRGHFMVTDKTSGEVIFEYSLPKRKIIHCSI